jgi:CelD/BcsL family acetyltransferase involved in cellulose biosynthesis
MRPHLKTKLYAGLRSLPDSYSNVFEAGAQTSFFMTRDWFENFTEHIVPDTNELRIYGVESADGNSVAALPMIRVPSRRMFGPATLESLSNYYTCFFAPVIRQDQDAEEAVEALTAVLWNDRQEWDVLNLKPIARDSAIFDRLVRAFRASGMVVQPYACFANWYLEVAGRSYKEYLESQSSVLRKNIPYNIRRLEKSGHNEIVILTNETGLEKYLDDYEKVYSASWKIREATPEFIRGMARIAARNGWLRLGLVYVDGEPAAAQLWVVYKGTASIYKIAYDERFAKLSVGTVLTAKLMQRVIDVDKVTIVDYLSGEDEYKKRWMSHRREFWGILAFNPRTVRGMAQIARHVGMGVGKRTVQKLAGKAILEKLMRWKDGLYRATQDSAAEGN